MDFINLAAQCSPHIALETIQAVVHVESSFNPYAIGVVNGRLTRQPTNLLEAVATVRHLKKQGIKFSAGIGQIYYQNWPKLGLNDTSVFDPCANLKAAQTILSGCYARALAKSPAGEQQQALRQAISCYYSNNFITGFQAGYVQKVVDSAGKFAGNKPASPPAQ